MKHMPIRMIPVFILLFLVTHSLTEARSISLGEALSMAQAHSFDIKRTMAEAEAANQQLAASKSERLPTLSLNANAFYNDYVPTLKIEIPPAVSIEREVGVHDNYQTDVRLTLPLYTGGKIGSGIGFAQSEQKVREALAQATKDQIALSVRTYWFKLSRSTELVRATTAARKRVEIVNKDVQSLYDAGAADSVDILDAAIALTKASADVDAATSQKRSDEIGLAILLGIDPNESLEIVDTLPMPTADTLLPESFWTSNPNYVAATGRSDAARQSLRLAQSDYLPTLAAYAGYSYGKPNLDRFNNDWNGNATVGATLSWSLNIGGKSFKSAASKRLLIDAAQQQQNQVAEQLSREAQLARERMNLALDQYMSAMRTYDLSNKNYALAQGMHGEGAISTNRLLEIETDLSRAEAAMTAAKSDFYITQSSWYYTIGSDKLQKGIE